MTLSVFQIWSLAILALSVSGRGSLSVSWMWRRMSRDILWQCTTVEIVWRNVTEDVTQDRILISNRPEFSDQVTMVIKDFLGVNSYHRNNSGPVSCLASVEQECRVVGSGAIRRDFNPWNSNENMRQVPSQRQRTEHFHMRRDRQMRVDTGLTCWDHVVRPPTETGVEISPGPEPDPNDWLLISCSVSARPGSRLTVFRLLVPGPGSRRDDRVVVVLLYS